MQDKFKARLQRIANYLLSRNDMMILQPQVVIFYDEEKQVGYQCSYHGWLFLDLPWMSQGFSFEGELPILIKDLNTGKESWESISANPIYEFVALGPGPFRAATCVSILQYLNLEPEEFLHLFGTKGFQQPEKFGGIMYPAWKYIKPRHIAQNILEFIPKKTTMKEKHKPDYRGLRMFADFLYSQTEPENKTTEYVTMTHTFKGGGYKKEFIVQRWVFNLLPDCFERWYFDSMNGEPKYGPAESTDTISDVFSFFEIPSIEAFEQMFTDKKADANSTCKAIAESILTWIKSQENEE